MLKKKYIRQDTEDKGAFIFRKADRRRDEDANVSTEDDYCRDPIAKRYGKTTAVIHRQTVIVFSSVEGSCCAPIVRVTIIINERQAATLINSYSTYDYELGAEVVVYFCFTE